MKVLVDAREFIPGRLTGIGRLLLNILVPLNEMEDGPELVLVGNPAAIPPQLVGPRITVAGLPPVPVILTDQVLIPRLAARHRCDLIFTAYYKAPLFTTLPVVNAVHDIRFLRHPGGETGLRRKLIELQLRAAMHKAKRTMTISEFSKQDLIQWLPGAAKKIRVAHCDLSEAWLHLAEWTHTPPGIESRYLLYVGTFAPCKNVDLLVQAVAQLKADGAWEDRKLVLVGGRGEDLRRVRHLAGTLNLLGDLYFVDFAEESKLVQLYKFAEWFVTLSGYEGFGLPPLEALSCGCPVVYHHATSMIEVLDGAAMPVESLELAQVCTVLKKALTLNAKEREKYREAGLRRARDFAPGTCAAKVLAIFEEVAPGRTPETGQGNGD